MSGEWEMSWPKVTAFVIIATVFLLVLYDLGVALTAGPSATISLVLYHAAQKWPVIPLFFGILMGHLFAQNSSNT